MSQAGYKEGYLTKRGKNFGGWKTRYFVLQGPSLEYYESVSTPELSIEILMPGVWFRTPCPRHWDSFFSLSKRFPLC